MLRIVSLCASMFLLASCATIFSGVKAKVWLTNDRVKEPVNITADNKHYENVLLPYKVKVRRGYSNSNILITSNSYEPYSLSISKRFNAVSLLNIIAPLGFAIDAATGAIMRPDEKSYYVDLKHKSGPYGNQSVIINNTVNVPQTQSYQQQSQQTERVSRDNPGMTDLENVIIRWAIDSDPQGARVFWRVISNIPQEVKNTNETYLMTTPYEETRPFNILGLTYENSTNVQIEIKLTKRGYADQVKRFNVRQAIDQQEISTFFELVPENY